MREAGSYDTFTALVEQRLKAQHPFACFRLPQEGTKVSEVGLQRVAQVTPTSAEALRSLAEVAGFLVAPFADSPTSPMLFITSESPLRTLHLSLDTTPLQKEPPSPKVLHEACPPSYTSTFSRFMQRLEQGEAAKLVLAHRADLPPLPVERLVAGFCRALSRYPDAFVALYYTPQSGLWLSATPEMLLRGTAMQYQTVALAGTMPRQKDTGLAIWSEKNRQEHQFVSDFIAATLTAAGIPFTTHPLESMPVGKLQHLQARFTFQMPSGYAPITLAEQLHPTPAICGTPQARAEQIILKEEPMPRAYYAGCIGWYEPRSMVELFVHIRCLQLLPHEALRLYAGGGILQDSDLESEWREVQEKMASIYSLM